MTAFGEDVTSHCIYGEIFDLLLPPYDKLPWPAVRRVHGHIDMPFVDTELFAVVGYPWY